MIKKILYSTPFLAIVCCLLWATPFVGIKVGLKYVPPLQFAGLRFFVAGLLILPFIPDCKNRIKQSLKYWKLLLIITGLQTTFLYSLFYIGLAMVPGSLGALIVGSNPIFVALTAHFFMPDDRMTWKKTVAILIGILGVIIVSFSGNKGAVNASQIAYGSLTMGILILVAKNFVGSYGNILIAKSASKIYPRVLAAFTLSVGGLSILILSELFERPNWTVHLPLEFYLTWIWLALVSTFAIAIWYTLLQRPGVKVSTLNFWTFIIPVFGAIFSWIFLPNEKPDRLSLIGMLVIGLSLVLINYHNRKAKVSTINRIKTNKSV
ncbi:MAG: DMT family transporter [Massilibacteroides sp.]|nr:DMT family transporter [Massilibacteroides sp.]